MNEVLTERIRRRLETLPDDKLYPILDYIEFLESRHNRSIHHQRDHGCGGEGRDVL